MQYPFSGNLPAAHRMMMTDLVREAGCFRSGNVGVFNNGQLIHASSPGVGTVIYPLSYRGGYWFRRVL